MERKKLLFSVLFSFGILDSIIEWAYPFYIGLPFRLHRLLATHYSKETNYNVSRNLDLTN